MTQEELAQMLDHVIREVTEQTTGVQLHASDKTLSGKLCTVHVSFNKGFHSSLSLCAEMPLLEHMARQMFGGDISGEQDVVDFAKEYVNILCGKVVGFLYRTTRIGASFGVPAFSYGSCAPQDQKVQFALTYVNERQEGAQLLHYIPCV